MSKIIKPGHLTSGPQTVSYWVGRRVTCSNHACRCVYEITEDTRLNLTPQGKNSYIKPLCPECGHKHFPAIYPGMRGF